MIGTGKLYKYKFLSDDESTSSDEEQESHVSYCPCRVIRIPSRYLAMTTVCLPLGAFLFSIYWALYSNYRAATLVYCHENQVFNYLPSLSAAIGDFPFSKQIWITSVTIHAPPRFLYAYLYHRYLGSVIYKRYLLWVNLAFILNIVENLGLLGLSYISSKASLPLHAFNFTVFIISSELYMIMLCVLLSKYRNIPAVTSLEVRSLKVKQRLLIIILSCSLVLPYIYHRHNKYCEEGVYTIFALIEYVVVICNMGFHMTAYWDFYDVIFKLPFAKWWHQWQW